MLDSRYSIMLDQTRQGHLAAFSLSCIDLAIALCISSLFIFYGNCVVFLSCTGRQRREEEKTSRLL